MLTPPLLQAAWLLSVVAQVAVAWRVISLGKVRSLPFFFSFLALGLRSFILFWLSRQSPAYYYTWIIGESLSLVALAGASIEALRYSAHRYPSIGSFWRTGGLAVAGVSAAVAIAIGFLDVDYLETKHIVGAFLYTKHLILAGIAFALIGSEILLFSRLSIPMPANAIIHRRMLAAYAATGTLGAVLVNVWGGSIIANAASLALATACYGGWLVLLSERGDKTTPTKSGSLEDLEKLEEDRRRFDRLLVILSSVGSLNSLDL